MSTGAAGQWLRDHGLHVANRTVRSWCAPGGALAHGVLRTPGMGKRPGQFRIRVDALRALLASNDLPATERAA